MEALRVSMVSRVLDLLKSMRIKVVQHRGENKAPVLLSTTER